MPRQLTRQAVTRTCAVCERTLLTGERAVRFAPHGDDFVDVCPLCADIALEHCWIKEGSPTTPTVPNQRRRRRRGLASLFDPRRDPADEPVVAVAWDISWYQYRVTPESAQPVRLAERGHELVDLDAGYQRWNAHIEDDGRLVPE